MMQEQKTAVVVGEKIAVAELIAEDIVKVGQKRIRRPFQISMPRSGNDLKVIYDVLSPDFIGKEMQLYDGRDHIGAIVYKVEEHDQTMRGYNRYWGQTTLKEVEFTKYMIDYISKLKLKLIDPDVESYRNRNFNAIEKFLTLEIPNYLRAHLEELKIVDKKDLEATHIKFWRSLFASGTGKRERQLITHFMDWGNKMSSEMHSDKFLPQVPYIRNHEAKDELIKYTDEINKTAYDLYNDGSAYYAVVSMGVFRNAESVKQLADSISLAKQKFIVLKLLETDMITFKGFGAYAKSNFEYFLKTLKDIKTVDPEKTIGLLAGGGFGYALLGSGAIDFFTDTVNNYPQDGVPRPSKNHRGLLHPRTLSIEPIEGVKQHQSQNEGKLFYQNSIAQKYIGIDPQSVDRREWSIDVRKMGLLMWQQRMAGLLNTKRMKMGNVRFDEVYNSDFANLGSIVDTLCNG